MRKVLRTSLSIAATAATLSLPCIALADSEEIQIERKTTNTSPAGTVVVENESSHTFKLQGQTQVYTAPADVDLHTLNGKQVTISVDPSGKVTKVEKTTTTTY